MDGMFEERFLIYLHALILLIPRWYPVRVHHYKCTYLAWQSLEYIWWGSPLPYWACPLLIFCRVPSFLQMKHIIYMKLKIKYGGIIVLELINSWMEFEIHVIKKGYIPHNNVKRVDPIPDTCPPSPGSLWQTHPPLEWMHHNISSSEIIYSRKVYCTLIP